ncbi:MAG: vancomycin high temperature exclusion protein [Oscillospiraceae bacterium]
MKKQGLKRILFRVAALLLIVVLIGAMAILGINFYVWQYSADYILSSEEAAGLQDVDCILILGCAVWANNTPSPMLEDRLIQGIKLYEADAAPKIIVSGDHGKKYYDEVGVMRTYCLDSGVPSEDVFMDHAGFSTYESMYRARDIFEVKKAVIVTQKYHLYRAVYSARKLGIEAYGVASDLRPYAGQPYRDAREILARVKDFFYVIVAPEPTYLGDVIPVDGDGNVTIG